MGDIWWDGFCTECGATTWAGTCNTDEEMEAQLQEDDGKEEICFCGAHIRFSAARGVEFLGWNTKARIEYLQWKLDYRFKQQCKSIM